MLETCVTMEPGYYEFEDHAFFEIDDPVHILGREFNARQGKKAFIGTFCCVGS
jgi:hypothetical protein